MRKEHCDPGCRRPWGARGCPWFVPLCIQPSGKPPWLQHPRRCEAAYGSSNNGDSGAEYLGQVRDAFAANLHFRNAEFDRFPDIREGFVEALTLAVASFWYGALDDKPARLSGQESDSRQCSRAGRPPPTSCTRWSRSRARRVQPRLPTAQRTSVRFLPHQHIESPDPATAQPARHPDRLAPPFGLLTVPITLLSSPFMRHQASG